MNAVLDLPIPITGLTGIIEPLLLFALMLPVVIPSLPIVAATVDRTATWIGGRLLFSKTDRSAWSVEDSVTTVCAADTWRLLFEELVVVGGLFPAICRLFPVVVCWRLLIAIWLLLLLGCTALAALWSPLLEVPGDTPVEPAGDTSGGSITLTMLALRSFKKFEVTFSFPFSIPPPYLWNIIK